MPLMNIVKSTIESPYDFSPVALMSAPSQSLMADSTKFTHESNQLPDCR